VKNKRQIDGVPVSHPNRAGARESEIHTCSIQTFKSGWVTWDTGTRLFPGGGEYAAGH
jgi:hypothetical protein